ncbi:MAG: type II toxin-antitoxin system PemK/MazF family toxin [Phycisphaerae bacterium]|nr:type II toxin-antitoxin system PemK/MazF family toxin [Phycisphaerae bacterium]NUQ44806.1 type II toxin-antitoxin system PemK/MazF family toxin [Phycisphaerae bacterium]
MPLPRLFPGLVIHYAYLWRDEHRRGLEEGAKHRPCLVLAVEDEPDGTYVTVAPITHRSSSNPDDSIEIPAPTKQRLELDDKRSWVVVTDLNRFRWPGYDLRPIPGKPPGTFDYGVVRRRSSPESPRES